MKTNDEESKMSATMTVTKQQMVDYGRYSNMGARDAAAREGKNAYQRVARARKRADAKAVSSDGR